MIKREPMTVFHKAKHGVLLVLLVLSSHISTYAKRELSPHYCFNDYLPGKKDDEALIASSYGDLYQSMSDAVRFRSNYGGGQFKYRCRGYHILKGLSKVECKIKKNEMKDWEPKGEDPYCAPACPALPSTYPHASVTIVRPNDSLPSIAFVSCHQVYNEAVYNSLECNETGPPPLPIGTLARLDCHKGYSPKTSDDTMHCVEIEGKGEWKSKANWECAAQCREPAVRKNNVQIVRYDKKSYTEGDTVVLGCKEGHVKESGHETVKCEARGNNSSGVNFSGEWDQELLKCVAACSLNMSGHEGLKFLGFQSGSPESPDKERLLVRPKHKAHFMCEEGYKLVGEGSKTCRASGKWSKSVDLPTCEAQCMGFPYVENGEPTMVGVANGSKYHEQGQIIQYKCDKNFVLNRTFPSFLRCEKAINISSKWSTPAPKCEPACEVWFDIPNGGFSFSDTGLGNESTLVAQGTTATFGCKEGFKLEGANFTTCEKNYQWSPKDPPYCQKLCPKPPRSQLALLDPNNTRKYYSPEETVTYICEEGAAQPPDATMQVRCSGDRDDVAFVLPLPMCNPTCRTPPLVRNAKMEWSDQANAETSRNHSIIGTVVRYTCDPDYVLRYKDIHSLKCLLGMGLNAIWTGNVPTCDPTCANPTSNRTKVKINRGLCLENGRCRPEAEVQVDCRSGFYAPKTGRMKCETNGKNQAFWSPRFPRCVPMCSYKELTNAEHTKESGCNEEKYCIPGKRVQFKCPRGYAFEGGTPGSWPLCTGTDHAAGFAEDVPNCEEKFVEDRSEEVKKEKEERERKEKEQAEENKMVLIIILSVGGLVILAIVIGLAVFVVVTVKHKQSDGNQTERTTVDAGSVSRVPCSEIDPSTQKFSERTGRDETKRTEETGSWPKSSSKRGITTRSIKERGKNSQTATAHVSTQNTAYDRPNIEW